MTAARFTATLFAAAFLSLISCSKSPDGPQGNVPFQIKVDANGKKAWAEGDRVHVWHRESGDEVFTDDGAFTLAGTSGNIFEGTLKTGLADSKTYDWKVAYPYGGSADAEEKYFLQDGYGSKAHIASAEGLPLQGTLTAKKGSDNILVSMKDGFVTVEARITNGCMYDVPVSTLKAGPYTVIINDAPTIASGESASVFIPVYEQTPTGSAHSASTER